MRLGFHVSISCGFALSVQRAYELGCTTMQSFSRNPRGWTVKPMKDDDVAEFRRLREQWDIGPVFAHTNYLINLASKRPDLYGRSIEPGCALDHGDAEGDGRERPEEYENGPMPCRLRAAMGKCIYESADRALCAVHLTTLEEG